MERAGDLQRDDPCTTGSGCDEFRQVVCGSGGDDLPAAVVVGGGEIELREARQDVGFDATDDGGHAGGLERGCVGHGATADTDEPHPVIGGQDAGRDQRGDLAD